MGGKAEQGPFLWVSEYDEELRVTNSKRKGRSKKIKFVGWGSKPLIEFLQSIGKDTTQQISRYEVADVINKYVTDNKLLHLVKKKRVVADERLYSLFGKRSFLRIRIYDMLVAHYAEEQFESDDDIISSSEEENDGTFSEKQKSRKAPLKKMCLEAPKSCWAAIIPDNIKLLYLKRSLVQDLLKDPETFERKIIGSFVRVKSDPNDYLQKNSHQLLQVAGIKKVSGTDDKSAEILLQVSNFVKDIQISTLSDDIFSVEECEDLCQRVKDGSLKRPTVVEFEEKTLILHEDITKHWIVGELALLQKLIDRANEKGWRKAFTLFDYLERRQLLQTPAEQERLLHEVPKVIAEELEASPKESPDNMEKGNSGCLIPNPRGASEVPVCDIAVNCSPPSSESLRTKSREIEAPLPESEQLKERENGLHLEVLAENFVDVIVSEPEKQPSEKRSGSHIPTPLVEIDDDNEITVGLADPVVIDLSDDEQNEDPHDGNQMNEIELRRLEWYYADPQGDIQGPFSIAALKRWWDDEYFSWDFKVWKSGQGQENALLLTGILQELFPS